MLVAVIDRDAGRHGAWRERLAALGWAAEAGTDADALSGRAAEIVLLVEPPAAGIARALAGLAVHGDFAAATVLVVAGADAALLRHACRIAGAVLLEAAGLDLSLDGHLRLAARLAGETARRRALEDQRRRLEDERLALRSLSPFAGGGRLLSESAGRYRAQRLLAAGPAIVIHLALDDLGHWRAGYGRDALRATLDRVEARLAAVPGSLGDMIHVRGEDGGWGLWLAGNDRAMASASARQMLDAVVRAGLHHAPARPESLVTLSAGVATAPREGSARQAEAAADSSLRLAASLGGNRIRWAD
ncbi:hypothetical protein [Zavarzinia compransoris]|uniref:GGDEF domain-containing protein n=1 Tax=Zavarzinia compransoris TaxID=1264899 RepID=A0A317E2N9_9PROT|nr:hypothetical protein [Zavarzinia compransoris]PWR20862.1 hypothetical protein DKG75_12790 [Zavarzinia compransoris]TDP44302.1 hypothetical protein DES42_10767 [Zavarzinia compransoris]